MTTFDTNIVVRLIVKDDEVQHRQSEALLRSALAQGELFLPKVVLVETAWVLRVAYRFDRQAIAEALRWLVDLEGVAAEDGAGIRRALARYERGTADFSDYVILEAARQANALPVRTFDRLFATETDVEILNG